MLASREFLLEELKWKEDVEFETHWSQKRNVMWISFSDEHLVSSIFRHQAELGNPKIRLLKYTPPWCHEQNKELEILCQLERVKNLELRTKVLLGHNDLRLCIKNKGDPYYRRVFVNYFGTLPDFNFTRTTNFSPGLPKGRRRFNSDKVAMEAFGGETSIPKKTI